MGGKVMFFHTTMNTPNTMKQAFFKRFPEAELINIVDDSILPEVKANKGEYTQGIVKKLINYGRMAEESGASIAVCMCTTITKAVEEAAKELKIPFITIDGPMLEYAVRNGNKIALLVTADTTIKASGNSAKAAAIREGKDSAKIDIIFVENASDALNKENNKEKHDMIIAEYIKEAEKDYDIIVLAQVTMADAAKLVTDNEVKVLTSIEMGLEQLSPYIK
jgi:glutamate racemase